MLKIRVCCWVAEPAKVRARVDNQAYPWPFPVSDCQSWAIWCAGEMAEYDHQGDWEYICR